MEKANEIFVICPFSRMDFKQNVIDNFSRQTFANKHLIVVENGDAIGAFNDRPWVTQLQSDNSAAAAKNVGLQYLQSKYDKAYWTVFDDDDYYGKNYLQELIDHSDKADIVGKLDVFAQMSDGYIKYLKFSGENARVKNIWGATISAWATDSVLFNEDGYVAEDAKWLADMISEGYSVYATSRHNFYINRGSHEHSWTISDEDFLNLPKLAYGVDYLGDFEADKEQIVGYVLENGRLPAKVLNALKKS